MIPGLVLDTALDATPPARCVVRLVTSAWSDSRGVHLKKSLQFLRRKSIGYNILEDEVDNTSALEAIHTITNFDTRKDGIYEVIAVNITRDWETGYIDGYDLKLIPYVE